MARRWPLPATFVVLAAAATAALAGTASAKPAAPFEMSGLQGGKVEFRDTILSRKRFSALATQAGFWGGPITAANGETVNIQVSDAYPVEDTSLPQSVADFLVQLYHGSELQTVSIYLMPIGEVQQACGPDAGGCYSPGDHRLIAPGEDLGDGVSKETILAHEYGHHVAASRDNAPWLAIDWGPKRWATAMNICARTAATTAFPGDEGDHYLQNPGEAWAETFRLLNYQKTTWPNWILTPFNVDQSFYPDTTALGAALQDVVSPWTAPTASTLTGKFVAPKAKVKTKKGKAVKPAPVKLTPWKRAIATTLDGNLTVSLTSAPAGTTLTLTDPATGKTLAGPARSVTYTDCGARSVLATVKATKAGAFTLNVLKP